MTEPLGKIEQTPLKLWLTRGQDFQHGSNAVNACRVLADGVVVGTSPAGGQTPTATIAIPAAATQQLITVEGYVAGLTGGRTVNSSGTFLTLA